MTKKNQANANKKNRRSKPAIGKAVGKSSRGDTLNRVEMMHAKMLMDPCGSMPTEPVYGSSRTGILMKFKTSYTIGNANSGTVPDGGPTTAGLFSCVPAIISNTSGSATSFSGAFYVDAELAASGFDNLADVTRFSVTNPGDAYIQVVAGAYRTLAYCMKVQYSGSEVNRQGFTVMGPSMARANTVVENPGLAGLNVNSYFTTLAGDPKRTPDGALELVWVPNDYEKNWRNPSNLIDEVDDAAVDYSKLQSLNFAYRGLANNTGFTVNLYSVVEWQPLISSGGPAQPPAPSGDFGLYEKVAAFVNRNAPDAVNTGRAVRDFMRGMTEYSTTVNGYLKMN